MEFSRKAFHDFIVVGIKHFGIIGKENPDRFRYRRVPFRRFAALLPGL